MNVEIESCLNTLRDHPRDGLALRTLEGLRRADGLSLSEAAAVAAEQSLEYHTQHGDWELVVLLLDIRIACASDTTRRAELLVQKARVLEDELLEEEAALDAFRAALGLRPNDEATREAIDHILLIRDNWEKVAAKYVEEGESAADRQLATSLFLSAAEVVWRSSSSLPQQIEEYLRRALEVEPRNRKASVHLERLLRLQRWFPELAQVLEQRADVAASRQERLAALLAAGDLWAAELGKPDEAAVRYRRALSIDPSDARALRYLVDTLTAQESWSALIRLYEEALRARPGTEQEAGILLQIGVLYDRKLKQPDQAEEYYRRVRKTDPAQPLMLDFYRAYYRERKEAVKILALLDGAQRMETDAAHRRALVHEMAQVAEEEVGNLEKAIDIWKGIQRVEPTSAEAIGALKRLYRSTQPPKWIALRELLKDEIESLRPDQVEGKIRLLTEVAEIYRDHLKLDAMVINTYNAILALRPDHAEAMGALAEKYEAMERWNDLIGLLLRRKEAQSDPTEKIQTLHRVAALWIERFGNQSQAIRPLEEVLALDPLDTQALTMLREVHTKRRNWRELMELLRLEAAHREPEHKRALYKEMAHLAADKLGDAREGIQVWNHVLEEDPQDREALAELVALYRREERWAALAEVLHRQAAALRDNPAEALPILESLGDLYTNRLRAVDNAIEVWREVLELRPDAPKARAVLRELYVQQQRWDDVEQLFRARGELSELAETLLAAADRSGDRELKVKLYARVGDICGQDLGNADRATKAYERVTAIDPQNLAAARALVPLYRSGEKWARLLATYEVLFEHAAGDSERLALYAEVVPLCEKQLGSKTLAFQWQAQAFAIAPDDGAVRAELERLAAEAEAWEELVRIYGGRVGQIADPAARLAMVRDLARLCSDKLHRVEEAEAHYRQLLELAPEDLSALDALEQIYTATARWADLVGIYRRRVALETDERRVDLLFRTAHIQEERLGDPVAAIDSLAAVLVVQPENLRALRSLERLYQVRGEWRALADLLGRELELVHDSEARVEILYGLGELLRSRLDRTDAAIDAFAQVLVLDAVHRGTVQSLEGILAVPSGHQVRVAQLLQPFYERAEDWARLVQVTEVLLAAEEDRPTQVAHHKRLMQLCGKRLDRLDAAFAAGSNVLALDPGDAETRREMAVLADRLDRVDELAGLLIDALDHLPAGGSHDVERALSWEVAVLLDERLGRSEEAERHLRRVMELDPGFRDALDALERILRDGGKWTELRDLLERRKELAEAPGVRRDILVQISALNEDVLGDAPAAMRAYEEMLQIEPDNAMALRALERNYAGVGRWIDLVNLLRREMDFAHDDETLNELKLRQAELLASQLRDSTAATDLLEEVVALDPNLQRAVDLLEQLKEHPELRRRITEILEPVYERRENWADLVRVLRVRRELEATDRFEATELLCRVARLHQERLRDLRGALAAYHEALLLEPGAPKVQDAVQTLAAELGAWPEVAAIWQGAFDAADPADLTLRGRLLARLASVLDEKLADAAGARRTYEQLLQLDPGNLELARPAAEALARLYEQASATRELIDILHRLLGWSESGDDRKRLLLRIAHLQEEVLGQAAAAVDTYRELLDENPAAREPLDALERLYLQAARWADLVDVYRRRVGLAENAEGRRAGWLRIAGLYEEELHDTSQAVAAYVTVLDELPADLEALRALARIYRKEQRWPDLLEMLERQLPLLADETRIDLLFEAATLQHLHLHDVGVAIGRYQEILALQPAHAGVRAALEQLLGDPDERLRVADLLAPIYQSEGSWESLIRLLELKVETADPATRIAQLRHVARLCEEGMDDVGRAFDAYRRALAAAAAEPDLLELAAQLQRLAKALDRWADFVAALEAVVPDVMSTESQKSLHLTAAAVCRQELRDLERARGHYQAVVDSDPEHRGALEALDAIHTSLEHWDPLLVVVLRRAELETDDHARRGFLLRAAAVYREKLGRLDEAIAEYEQVLGMFATDGEAVTALDELYCATARWADLADLLGRRLQTTDEPADRVMLLYRLGRLRAEHLADPLRALEAYQEVLGLEPAHVEVVQALEGYLESPDLRVDAARILEPLYVSRQDWRRLIHIYEIRLEAADEPERRLQLSTRIAQLYEEQLEDLEGAFTWYGRVFLETPADTAIRDQLLRLGGIIDHWPEVASLFAQYLERTLEEDEVTRATAILLGRIYDERLGRIDEAVGCYRRALQADREGSEAFELLEALLTRNERWQDLLALYHECADATPDVRARRELLFKRCRVWEEALEKLPEAIDAYRAVLDLDDKDAEALAALDRLYTDAGRWQDLTELLARQCELGAPEETTALKYRIATIYELHLVDLPTAIDHYEEVLRRDPGHLGAVAALERLILDRDQRFRISQILEPLYVGQDEWAKLVVIYDAQLDFIDERDRRTFLLREIARLHEERDGSLELAFRALARAFQEEASSVELLAEVERLAGLIDGWRELVAVLKQSVSGCYDFELVGRIQAKIAEIYEQRLGDKPAAVDSWRQVLSAQETSLEAIDALVRLLGELGRHEALIEILGRKAELSADVEVRRTIYYRIAEIHETLLAREDRAIDVYRQVLTLDENDRVGLDNLDRLYLKAGNWMELIWVYRRKNEIATDPEERRSLQLAAGQVYEEKVGDSFEAIASYKALLEAGHGDAPVLDALDRLYTKEGLHSDLLEIVELKIRAEGDVGRRNELLQRAGTILEQEIGDLQGAIQRYRPVIEADPAHGAARAALERLVRDESHRELVVEILEPLYGTLNELKPLADVLELRLDMLADPAARRALLVRLARLHEEGLTDPRAAFATYSRALAEDPASEEVQRDLDRLASQLGAVTELIALYRRRLETIYDMPLSRRIHLKVAGLVETVVGDDAGAEQHYRAALDCGGEELPVLQALDRVLTRQKKWVELLEVLRREVQASTDPQAQADLYHRAGEIQLAQQDLDSAFGSLREALARDPAHAGARTALEKLLGSDTYRVAVLDVLEPIYEESGDFGKVVDLLETRLSTVVDPNDRTRLLERIAGLHEEKLGSKDQALGAMGRAMAEDPANRRVLDEVERLATELGRYAELTALADEILGGEVTSDGARELGLRTAAWYGERLGDLERSARCLNRVLNVDAECLAALEGLERIYRAGSQSAELAQVLWRRAELEQNNDRRRAILAEVAQVRQRELQDLAGAAAAWRAILDLDQLDGEALAALAALYEQTHSWEDYLGILDRQASQASGPAEQAALKHRAGEVLIGYVEDLDRAIAVYRDVLDLVPNDSRALTALEAMFTQLEDWAALQEILLRRADTLSGQERIPVYVALANLAGGKLHNVEEAIGYHQQILVEDPDNLATITALEQMLRDGGKWYDLVEVLRRHAGLLARRGDLAGEVEQLTLTARVWSENLENPDAAAELLEEILRRDERNVTALADLARIYEKTRQWDRCRAILQRAAALGPEPGAAAELEFRLGRVELEQGGDEQGAAARFARALELDPTHGEAQVALVAVARKQQDWPRLAQHLELRAASAPEGARLPLLCELGAIYLERLKDGDKGVAAFERARALGPENVDVLTPLANAYYAAGRYDAAAPLLQRLVDMAGRRRTKDLAHYIYRLGAIAEKQGDTAAAREHYDHAYRIDSTHGPTLVALGRIYVQLEDWQNARKIYRSMLLQNMDESAGISKAEVFFYLGQAHVALGEKAKALSMFERGLEVAPDHPGLQEAMRKAKG